MGSDDVTRSSLLSAAFDDEMIMLWPVQGMSMGVRK